MSPITTWCRDKKNGVWHIAVNTYPASADTECGGTKIACTMFQGSLHWPLLPPGRPCDACIATRIYTTRP